MQPQELDSVERRSGFRLIHLLIVLVMIASVVGVIVSYVAKGREAADRAQSQSRLKQMTLATVKTAADFQGVVPRADYMRYPDVEVDSKTGKPRYGSLGSCFWHILPNLEQVPLFESGKDGDTTAVSVAFAAPIATYIGPGDPTNGPGETRGSYLANPVSLGDAAVLGAANYHRYPASYSDGTSHTIAYVEGYSIAGKVPRNWHDGSALWVPGGAIAFQIRPHRDDADTTLPQGFSTGGIQVSMFDGSVKNVWADTSASTFHAACTIDAKDRIGNDW